MQALERNEGSKGTGARTGWEAGRPELAHLGLPPWTSTLLVVYTSHHQKPESRAQSKQLEGVTQPLYWPAQDRTQGFSQVFASTRYSSPGPLLPGPLSPPLRHSGSLLLWVNVPRGRLLTGYWCAHATHPAGSPSAEPHSRHPSLTPHCLERWLPDLCGHRSHLEGWLKHRHPGLHIPEAPVV